MWIGSAVYVGVTTQRLSQRKGGHCQEARRGATARVYEYMRMHPDVSVEMKEVERGRNVDERGRVQQRIKEG